MSEPTRSSPPARSRSGLIIRIMATVLILLLGSGAGLVWLYFTVMAVGFSGDLANAPDPAGEARSTLLLLGGAGLLIVLVVAGLLLLTWRLGRKRP